MAHSSFWQGEKAIVCDPNPVAQDHLRQLLVELGLKVLLATDLAATSDLLVQEQPKLVFTELFLPDAEGSSIVGHLRQLRRESKIVVCTVWSRRAVVVAAHRAGAADFLTKPVWPDRIKATVGGLSTVSDRSLPVLSEA